MGFGERHQRSHSPNSKGFILKLRGRSRTWSLFILGSRGSSREGAAPDHYLYSALGEERAKGGFRTSPTNKAVPPQTLWYNEHAVAILLKKGTCPSYFLLLCFSCLGTNGRLYRSHLIPVSPLQWGFLVVYHSMIPEFDPPPSTTTTKSVGVGVHTWQDCPRSPLLKVKFTSQYICQIYSQIINS